MQGRPWPGPGCWDPSPPGWQSCLCPLALFWETLLQKGSMNPSPGLRLRARTGVHALQTAMVAAAFWAPYPQVPILLQPHVRPAPAEPTGQPTSPGGSTVFSGLSAGDEQVPEGTCSEWGMETRPQAVASAGPGPWKGPAFWPDLRAGVAGGPAGAHMAKLPGTRRHTVHAGLGAAPQVSACRHTQAYSTPINIWNIPLSL